MKLRIEKMKSQNLCFLKIIQRRNVVKEEDKNVDEPFSLRKRTHTHTHRIEEMRFRQNQQLKKKNDKIRLLCFFLKRIPFKLAPSYKENLTEKKKGER